MNTISPEHLQPLWTLLHKAPMALAETDRHGKILHLNPKAVQLMMPLAAHLSLPGDNLLDTLSGFVPLVRRAIAEFEAACGLIMDQEPYRIEFFIGQTQVEQYWCLSVEKLSSDRLLFCFVDVTNLLLKADSLRQTL